MSLPRSLVRSVFALGLGILLAWVPRLPAQPAKGAIAGVVANAGTRQFLTQAEVKVAATGRAELTARDGSYRLADLPPGQVELIVSYAGLDAERRIVTVVAGETSRQDFSLGSGIYRLDAVVIAAEVEGNAAAVNQQRKSDVFMAAISADTLGNVSEGNIGEFLRYVPGIQVNFSNADASTVSMRGQNVMAHTPLKRFGEARELLGAVSWLLDDERAGFVTGITVSVDGGFSACSGI